MSSKHHELLGLTEKELEAHKTPDGKWRHTSQKGEPVIPRNLTPEALAITPKPYPIADQALATFPAKERELIVNGVPASVTKTKERAALQERVDRLRAEYENGGKVQ